MRNYAVILILFTVLACCNGPVAETSMTGKCDQNTDPLAKSLPPAPPVRSSLKKHDQATDNTANQIEAGSKWNVMKKLGIWVELTTLLITSIRANKEYIEHRRLLLSCLSEIASIIPQSASAIIY